MRAKNQKTIERAFNRLVANKNEVIESAMYSILEDAVKYALELHEEDANNGGNHDKHLLVGDTYGWLLMHNGSVVEAVVVSLPENEGDAMDQLREEAAFIDEKGWVGIVMAGMHPEYFSIRFENLVLDEVINNVERNFFKYFKKI